MSDRSMMTLQIEKSNASEKICKSVMQQIDDDVEDCFHYIGFTIYEPAKANVMKRIIQLYCFRLRCIEVANSVSPRKRKHYSPKEKRQSIFTENYFSFSGCRK